MSEEKKKEEVVGGEMTTRSSAIALIQRWRNDTSGDDEKVWPQIKEALEEQFSPSIPWRKPEEEPEKRRRVHVLHEDGSLGTYDFIKCTEVYGWECMDDEGYRLWVNQIAAWCYADEIPLPDWVQK